METEVSTKKSNKLFVVSLYSIAFAPLVVLISRALKNQQADNLLPAFFSTDHLTWFYWDQDRYGSIHSFLAFPIQNIDFNLKFQLVLRAASLIFVFIWTIETVRDHLQSKSKNAVTYVVSLTSVLIFGAYFPEMGDSLIYGANAHPIAAPFGLLAVSVFYKSHSFNSNSIQILARIAIIGFFWCIAIWTSLFVVLWAPSFLILQAVSLSRIHRINFRDFCTWVSINAFFVFVFFKIFSNIARNGGENSSLDPNLFRNLALHIDYIYMPLLIEAGLLVVLVVLGIFKRNTSSFWIQIVAASGFLATVPIISSSVHVQQYSFMPRYFGVPFFFALVIIFVLLSEIVKPSYRTGNIQKYVSYEVIRTLALLVMISSLLFVAFSKVEFGSGKVDASGFVNTGQGIEADDINRITKQLGQNPTFIAGSYWYVWPLVFEFRNQDVEVQAITKKATNQRDFKELYSASPVLGLCVGETVKCWGSTINAQLDGKQLFFEIDSTFVHYLADGTPLRRMWVSKYPIRKLER